MNNFESNQQPSNEEILKTIKQQAEEIKKKILDQSASEIEEVRKNATAEMIDDKIEFIDQLISSYQEEIADLEPYKDDPDLYAEMKQSADEALQDGVELAQQRIQELKKLL